MQVTIPPSELIESLVEPPGFTLVEEDDVAFCLGLCREVNRIYLDYQEGRLAATDAVHAGLSVTVEMLAVLSRSVRDGMPGMRITVAAAQTREMLAVVFGQDPMNQPMDARYRNSYRALVSESAFRMVASGPARRELENASIDRPARRRRWFGFRRS